MKKKIISTLLCASMVASMAAGCGSSDTADTTTTETTATLRFTEDPDTILSVQCWSDEHWGEPATNSEDVTIVGNVLTLKLGGYIYEVTAEWNTENGYGGTASYFIYLKTAD